MTEVKIFTFCSQFFGRIHFEFQRYIFAIFASIFACVWEQHYANYSKIIGLMLTLVLLGPRVNPCDAGTSC